MSARRSSTSTKARPLVGITKRLPPAVESALAEHFEVFPAANDAPLTPKDLGHAMREVDAILCTVTDPFEATAFAGTAPLRTRILANFGVGTNHIALDAAKAAGVVVTNTPDVLTEDTADLAIALMLAVGRRLGEGERELRAGKWKGWRPTHMLGHSLQGKTLGVVGLGRIGRAVARRAEQGFGMKVLAWSRSKKRQSEMGTRIERVNRIDDLLERSDIVSVHCPLVPTTHHLIGAAQFDRMRKHAILINTSRGPVVDEAALVAALQTGKIWGAGLDVYEKEPEVHPGLLALENVVLVPHLGSATQETREAMGMRALANLKAFFEGREPPDRVV